MGQFILKTRVYLGKDGLDEILKGVDRAFIVTDKFMHESGMVGYLTEPMEKKGVQYQIFSDVKPDPDIATVTKGIGQLLDFKPQVLFALGGGSSIDAAKAMNWLSVKGGLAGKMTFVAVPTTSGTGSEVTTFAVISDPQKSAKYPLVSEDMLPDAAILDAELVRSVPPKTTADTGIDVLTHAIEAYVSIMATPFTDGLALQAMKAVFDYLPSAYENGANDPYARERMAEASCMAGMAFANAFLGVNHSMAHKLGAYHHLPHGVANAVILTDVIRYNAAEVPTKMGTFSQYQYPHAKQRYVEAARYCGIQGKNDDEVFENFIQALEDLKEKIGIKKTIKDYGVDEKYFLDTLDEMVENAFNDQCTGANPRYPLMSEIKEIYLKCYYGK